MVSHLLRNKCAVIVAVKRSSSMEGLLVSSHRPSAALYNISIIDVKLIARDCPARDCCRR